MQSGTQDNVFQGYDVVSLTDAISQTLSADPLSREPLYKGKNNKKQTDWSGVADDIKLLGSFGIESGMVAGVDYFTLYTELTTTPLSIRWRNVQTAMRLKSNKTTVTKAQGALEYKKQEGGRPGTLGNQNPFIPSVQVSTAIPMPTLMQATQIVPNKLNMLIVHMTSETLYQKTLQTHLAPDKRQYGLNPIHVSELTLGALNLQDLDRIPMAVLLMSPSLVGFFAEEGYDLYTELVQRYNSGEMLVTLVDVAAYVKTEHTPFSKLLSLPNNGRGFPNSDGEAWMVVVRALTKAYRPMVATMLLGQLDFEQIKRLCRASQVVAEPLSPDGIPSTLQFFVNYYSQGIYRYTWDDLLKLILTVK
jgi:hypothetical protein